MNYVFVFVLMLLGNVKSIVVEYDGLPNDIMDPTCMDMNDVFCGCGSDELLIGVYKAGNGTSLDYMDGFRCAKPNNTQVNACLNHYVLMAFNESGNITCPDGYFVRGFRLAENDDNTLLNIEFLRCCKSSTTNGRDNPLSDEVVGIWGESCLGYGKSGWCGIGDNAFITGFKRILNYSLSSSILQHGINNIVEVYYKSVLTPGTGLTPTNSPTNAPSINPSINPTINPTNTETINNNLTTNIPTSFPTNIPSNKPAVIATTSPQIPNINPTNTPLKTPTNTPSQNPTITVILSNKNDEPKLDKKILIIILGGSVAILALILIVIVLVCMLIRKRKTEIIKASTTSTNSNDTDIPSQIPMQQVPVISQSNISSNVSSHDITTNNLAVTMESLYDQTSEMEGFGQTTKGDNVNNVPYTP